MRRRARRSAQPLDRMREIVPLADRLPAAVLTGLVLGALFSHLWLWTFHQARESVGPIELFDRVTKVEVIIAAIFGVSVFSVTVWRMLRGSSVRDEVDSATEVLDVDDGD